MNTVLCGVTAITACWQQTLHQTAAAAWRIKWHSAKSHHGM